MLTKKEVDHFARTLRVASLGFQAAGRLTVFEMKRAIRYSRPLLRAAWVFLLYTAATGYVLGNFARQWVERVIESSQGNSPEEHSEGKLPTGKFRELGGLPVPSYGDEGYLQTPLVVGGVEIGENPWESSLEWVDHEDCGHGFLTINLPRGDWYARLKSTALEQGVRVSWAIFHQLPGGNLRFSAALTGEKLKDWRGGLVSFAEIPWGTPSDRGELPVRVRGGKIYTETGEPFRFNTEGVLIRFDLVSEAAEVYPYLDILPGKTAWVDPGYGGDIWVWGYPDGAYTLYWASTPAQGQYDGFYGGSTR